MNVGRKNHSDQKVSLRRPASLGRLFFNSEFESDSDDPVETIVDFDAIESLSEYDSYYSAGPVSQCSVNESRM